MFAHELLIRGARENNLKNIDVGIPIGVLTCVTGVSGSGKSSLINEILYKSLAASLNHAKTRAGKHDGIDGLKYVDKVIDIDQSPIGRTPRSNPATYTGVFNDIRELFASTQDAKMRGYNAGRFSFNVRGGRCEACAGDGLIKIEMHFLPDIYVPCEICKGRRYNRETLEVRYKGKNISEVLDMTIEEAESFFENIPKIRNQLRTMSAALKLGDVAVELLIKHTDVPAQSGVGSQEKRRANISGVYGVADDELIRDKRILLIDDIVTTGATLSECSKMLRLAGASEVVCCTLARTRE